MQCLLYYKCHKINVNRSGSYIDSLDFIKNNKSTRNLANGDDKCLEYAITVTFNHVKIEKICKEYQKSKLLQINITGKEKSTLQEKMTGKSS